MLVGDLREILGYYDDDQEIVAWKSNEMYCNAIEDVEDRWGFANESSDDKNHCVVANYFKGVPYNIMIENVEVIDLSKYNNVEYCENGNIIVDGKTIYLVLNGQIGYNDSLYPIKLPDGYYIIRKLTPEECEKLQTMPVGYTAVKGNSNTQRYKQLGNGWTAEVIKHIIQQWNIPLDEEIEVLSMYDGIATGRYVFDSLGYKNIKYKAYEIDKYAINVATTRYPDIEEMGDAFDVRDDNWSY